MTDTNVVIIGDLNGHVGQGRERYGEVMGVHGFGERNREGERILEFCQSRGLKEEVEITGRWRRYFKDL